MMITKPFLFLSDFDGTMSLKDFYHLFSESYLSDLDSRLLTSYRKREITSFGYLSQFLAALNLSEAELTGYIESLPIDPLFPSFVAYLKDHGGDFAVVSAGADYYIKPILDRIGLEGTLLFANQGRYVSGGICMEPPKEELFFCDFYGIDKEQVLQQFRSSHKTIIFAGDGSADFSAAKQADIVFAKGRLRQKMVEANIPHYSFATFSDIQQILKDLFIKN